MLKQLEEVLQGKEDNYLLPFYWQKGNHHDLIPEQIQHIYDSGARAFCVESRTHEDFAGDGWWYDMDLILSEAEKRGMKVWILDDKHFPTGFANGIVPKKYPDLRSWQIVEYHTDVVGPISNCTIFMETQNSDNVLLGVFAYKRTKNEPVTEFQGIEGKAIRMDDCVHGNNLYFSLPEGVWRIFRIYKSRGGTDRKNYIDMIRPEAVDALIEAVYDPHYAHYADKFGKVLAGFFSDEPSLGNGWFGSHSNDFGMYNRRVGMEGLALPYSEKLIEMMSEELMCDALPFLPALWYDYVGYTSKVRYSYMNAVTALYRDNFCFRLGNWSRAHGVEYIGHIIEDMNAHARLGCSAGHYFRSLEGQDMSGIDIVLHQIMPGTSGYMHTASCSGGYTDPDFFECVLGDLAGSMAQLYPQMKGRAMCEVFGAFGWAEGLPFMKWLMDYLLVRGVNHFVPHAFSPAYPDGDCPPHFGANGHDPQFEGFSVLMSYTNKVSHLLCGGKHISDAAILYHGELEWYNGKKAWKNGETDFDYMLTQVPARILSDANISYEIVPADVIEGVSGRFDINNYQAIIVPGCSGMPDTLADRLRNYSDKVVFLEKRPENCDFGKVVGINELTKEFKPEITFETNPAIRYYHCRRENADIYMFVNTSVTDDAVFTADLPSCGSYMRLDILNDEHVYGTTEGSIDFSLSPYQSQIIIFDGEKYDGNDVSCNYRNSVLDLKYDISLADADDMSMYVDYEKNASLHDICAPDAKPDFAGKIKYVTSFTCDSNPVYLDLGEVGMTAKVKLNGIDLGIRVCPPYRFNISDAIKQGENILEIEAANTLALRVRDWFSSFMQIPASGVMGPLTLMSKI